MQIHEITKAQLQEGIFDAFKTPDQIAAQAAQKLQAQGYGQPKPLPAVQDSVSAVQKNPAQQQYIKGLVSQWQQIAPKPTPAASAPATPAAPAATEPNAPFAGRSAPLPTVTVDGKLLTKGPDGLWHGEDGRAVTDPAQVAKIDKAYYTGMRNQKGTVKEAFRTPRNKRAAARAQRASTSRKPSTATSTTDSTSSYQTAFVKWAGEKLRTVDPATDQTITLDQVNSTPKIDIKDELDRALAQVVATAGDPAKNTVAVNNYLTIAVAGVARVSQKLRQDRVYGATDDDTNKPNTPTSTGQVGQAIVTQQEIRNKLAQEVGLSKTQIDALNKLGQDPAARAALLKSFGVQA
jgi:hypothetical protein